MLQYKHMTTQELVQKISCLTSEEKLAISEQVDFYLEQHRAKKHFKAYTRSEILAILEKSRKQAEQGQTIPAYQSLAQLRERYDLPA